MISDRNSPWVVMVYATDEKPAHLLCKRCNTEGDVPFPVGVTEFTKNIRSFIKSHRKCRAARERREEGNA